MAKISRSQQIFSEIELFLDAGKYEDAKVLLSFLDYNPLDRESRLTLLLINVTLDGPIPYKEPRYAAIAKSQIGAGTSISVLEAKGDWFKVQTRPSGDVGYVRREYLVRQSSTR